MRGKAKQTPLPEGARPLPTADLLMVAEAVKLRAEREGFVEVRDVRSELERVGSDATCWPQVLKIASSHLVHRDGKYYYVVPTNPQRERQEQQAIHACVHRLVDQYRLLGEKNERREASRIQFLQPVNVIIDGHVTHRALTRDISASGIRLLGTRSLLGQKVQVDVPAPEGKPVIFFARMVWTCAVGDDLYENGGVFLKVVEQ